MVAAPLGVELARRRPARSRGRSSARYVLVSTSSPRSALPRSAVRGSGRRSAAVVASGQPEALVAAVDRYLDEQVTVEVLDVKMSYLEEPW